MADAPPRLTALSRGGGCGCKLSPAVLADLLAEMPAMQPFPDLLVGTETGDDAAVYRINEDQALVATTDFFMPIVDDPYDFGRIAAANALSDIYAMGGRPLMALAILGMPLGRIEPAAVRAILAGGAAICAEAGIPVAGGHSIDASEPIYGLAVTGLIHPGRVLRNAGARPGDVLILGKPLGVGIVSAALKSGTLEPERERAAYGALVDATTRLNAVGPVLAGIDGVHAMTDVTGFGLLGHALEVCRASGCGAVIDTASLPLLEGIADLARSHRTGASARNWASYKQWVTLADAVEPWQHDVLTDPQTSGGLLVSVAAEEAGAVLDTFRAAGFAEASVIGKMDEGAPHIAVS